MAHGLKDQGAAGKGKLIEDQDDEEDSKLVGFNASNMDSENDDSDSDDEDDTNEDDDDDDDQGLTGVSEYNEDDEPFPNYVAYDKDFDQVGRDLINIPKGAIAIIDRTECSSKRVQVCRTNALEIATVPRPKSEKICLLGNTGAGKSSLLNAILGMPGLAKAMAGGQSCTYVGTEYQAPFSGQSRKFAAKVEYFDIEAIKDLLERLLNNYNIWTFQQDEDWTEDERQELKRDCHTAFTTFRALFCDKVEFESPRAAAAFLQQCYEREDADALGTMVAYCEELLEEKEANESDHIEYLDADSQPELLQQLNPLVSSNSLFEEPTLWPLVKKVTMGIEGHRLLRYITLVDLPGLDDTNQVRVNASLDIMRSCDSIWVVTKIDRAITDTQVDSLLMRYGKSFKMAIVCTAIDANLDDDLAAHLQAEGQSIGNHDELLLREKQLRKLTRSLPKKIETRRAKLEGRNPPRKGKKKQRVLTQKARDKLDAQIATFQAQLNDIEAELPVVAQARFEILVDARNHNTTRRLKEEKSDHLKSGEELKVFCVSNVHYMALKGARVINGPRLNADMTGIPAMRAFVLESAAPGLVKAVEDFINYKFTVFMKDVAMWAKSYSVEGSTELLRAVEAPREKIDTLLQGFHETMMTISDATVVKALDETRPDQLQIAIRELEKKRQWHWSTTRAFVRRNGTHKTSVAPKQCWNEQFMEGTIDLVKEIWDRLQEKRDHAANELMDELIGLVRGVWEMVKGHPAHMILPMDRVNEIFEAHLEGVKQACTTQQEDLNHELRNINMDLTQHSGTGYFSRAMNGAYEQCQADSGGGIKLRTFNTFENYLRLEGDRSPFAVVGQKFARAVSKDVREKTKPLLRKIDRVFRDLYTQFDDLVDTKMNDDREEEVRSQFRVYLRGAERNFEDIKGDLLRIKRRYEDAMDMS